MKPAARIRRAGIGRTGSASSAIRETLDVITCRGVLNDLITDEECVAALRSFADLCRTGGLLVLEVRDVGPSREQANGQPRTVVQLDGSRQLAFTSRPTWERDGIVITETYELTIAHAFGREARH